MQIVKDDVHPVGTYVTITSGVCRGLYGHIIGMIDESVHVVQLDPPQTFYGRDTVKKAGWRLQEMFDVGM